MYEQVVAATMRDVVLWRYGEEPWIGSTETQDLVCEVEVFTNREDARFVAEDGDGAVVAAGAGARQLLQVPVADGENQCSVTVKFLPVVTMLANGEAATLEAQEVALPTIDVQVGRLRWVSIDRVSSRA